MEVVEEEESLLLTFNTTGHKTRSRSKWVMRGALRVKPVTKYLYCVRNPTSHSWRRRILSREQPKVRGRKRMGERKRGEEERGRRGRGVRGKLWRMGVR